MDVNPYQINLFNLKTKIVVYNPNYCVNLFCILQFFFKDIQLEQTKNILKSIKISVHIILYNKTTYTTTTHIESWI